MIDQILEKEWKFFQSVQHVDGRAPCQDDHDTFYKQRYAQFQVYSDSLLASYYQDLCDYEEAMINPIMLKYAYMMKETEPEYYYSIEKYLLDVSDKLPLVNEIVQLSVTMRDEFDELHPQYAKRLRVSKSSSDLIDDISFETYLRCELLTYSFRSLIEYGHMIVECIHNHKNLIEMIQYNTIKNYGYDSFEQIEKQ